MPILETRSEETRVVVLYGERTHLLSTTILRLVFKYMVIPSLNFIDFSLPAKTCWDQIDTDYVPTKCKALSLGWGYEELGTYSRICFVTHQVTLLPSHRWDQYHEKSLKLQEPM